MSYNVAKYRSLDGFYGLQDGEKMADTHTHKTTIANGDNATQKKSLILSEM